MLAILVPGIHKICLERNANVVYCIHYQADNQRGIVLHVLLYSCVCCLVFPGVSVQFLSF